MASNDFIPNIERDVTSTEDLEDFKIFKEKNKEKKNNRYSQWNFSFR